MKTTKTTATRSSSCSADLCTARINVGDSIYMGDHGPLCQACGSQIATAHAKFGAAKSRDARARRANEESMGALRTHLERHGSLPAEYVATRSAYEQAQIANGTWFGFNSIRTELPRPCKCAACKVAA